ncbi:MULTISPECIES: type II secretion system protein GspL [Vibrio]|uniref:type II secretion system protein GspL n=1 Tax=Vibrio TaxID=662 RepID=UPI002075D3B2|nr:MULTISPECIES: type II secretion system protein GspL [Vibrio]USD32645.1 type II secretion system protein GspL [Vibrio sp. SCSIO 43186]USD45686.1 type II secretion system protein GspL [Vibrio sp. SCSIO 43145]USD69770.1 type II secretion system protein GspL [Vibrio sp. SCSIO 43139]USD94677.1 type II secretion system protein GspL [Vibrio coralliilyticus]
MNEFLVVRLSKSKTAAIQWLVWSESQKEVIASGELQDHQDLAELANYAEGRQVVVLVSAANLVLTQLDVPAGANRQFDSMLPFMLEDDVAQDVDELHFTVLAKEAGQAYVCGIDYHWLESILADMQQLGLVVRKVMPDALALPLDDNCGLSAVELDGQWLVKKGQFSGVSVEPAWLPLLVQSDWVKQGEDYLPLQAFSPLPELPYADGQEWRNEEPQLVMQLLAEQAVKSKTNLLSGEFKPKSSLGRHLKVWRKAAIAAGVLIVVLSVDNWLQIQSAETQANAYRQESERIFRQMTNKNKIPTVTYLKREMEREESRLSGGGSGDSVLEWMVKMPQVMKQVPGLKLTSFKYDSTRGEVRLQAQSNDFQTFEKARELMSSQFTVEQGQLSKSGALVNGTFVLKRL